MKIKPLPQHVVNKIGTLFFPNISNEWEIFDPSKLEEDSRWNGLDIVPKGWNSLINDIFQPLHCIQISLDENHGFFESIKAYDDSLGEINLIETKEMDKLFEILAKVQE